MADLLPWFDSYANITSYSAQAENTRQSPAGNFSSMADFLCVQKEPDQCPLHCPCCLHHGSRMWQTGQHVPATAWVCCSMLELWGSRSPGFSPDPLVSTGLSNKAFCLTLKHVENSEAECHPCKLYFTYGMHTSQNHCQIDRCHMKEKITRMCPEFRAHRENAKSGSS